MHCRPSPRAPRGRLRHDAGPRPQAAEHGQATVEHVALLLLVAALVLGALAAADAVGARSRVGDAVRTQLARAICLAGGGSSCDADRRACVVDSDSMAASASVGAALLRLREGGLLAVERRSDGTVTVTVVNELGADLAPPGGRRARLLTGRGVFGSGSSLDAALAGTIGDGVTWTLPDDAAAERLVRTIQGGSRLPAILRGVPSARRLPPGIPAPTAVSRRRELSGSLHLSLGAGPLRATVDLDARDVVAWGEEAATGRRSVVLARHAAAALAGRVGSRRAEAEGGGDEEVLLVFDAGGRPLEIVRVESADVRGSRDLPSTAQPAAGLLATRGGRRTAVVETHLDLGDAGNLRAAAHALSAARGGAPPWRAAALGTALRERFDRFGVVHARVYADDERRYGIDVPRGRLPIDLGISKTFTTTRLLAAATRGIDGLWSRRDDCLVAARAGGNG